MFAIFEPYTVSFFGHRQINCALQLEKPLEQIISQLLLNKEYVEFLVGRDGAFDLLVSATVKRCKKKYGEHNSALVWVLPYSTAELRDNVDAFFRYYDEIEICEEAALRHYKSAFQVRNRRMVDRSDLVIFYVVRESGGAYQTMKYAERTGTTLINLGEIGSLSEKYRQNTSPIKLLSDDVEIGYNLGHRRL